MNDLIKDLKIWLVTPGGTLWVIATVWLITIVGWRMLLA